LKAGAAAGAFRATASGAEQILVAIMDWASLAVLSMPHRRFRPIGACRVTGGENNPVANPHGSVNLNPGGIFL
jgi:hypothetical protein